MLADRHGRVLHVNVAFAGLSPMCEDILRAGLSARPDLTLVTPWTRLSLLGGTNGERAPQVLFVEVEGDELPPAIRLLLAAAEPLRIVGIASDASRATVFSLHERRTILLGVTGARLWRPGTLEDDL